MGQFARRRSIEMPRLRPVAQVYLRYPRCTAAASEPGTRSGSRSGSPAAHTVTPHSDDASARNACRGRLDSAYAPSATDFMTGSPRFEAIKSCGRGWKRRSRREQVCNLNDFRSGLNSASICLSCNVGIGSGTQITLPSMVVSDAGTSLCFEVEFQLQSCSS